MKTKLFSPMNKVYFNYFCLDNTLKGNAMKFLIIVQIPRIVNFLLPKIIHNLAYTTLDIFIIIVFKSSPEVIFSIAFQKGWGETQIGCLPPHVLILGPGIQSATRHLGHNQIWDPSELRPML